MEYDFGEWLEAQIRQRGWTKAQFARIAGIATGTVSNIVSGTRGVGENTLMAIASALHIPPETVFRAAGFIPTRPGIDPEVERLAYQIAALSPDKQAAIDNLIQFFLSQQQGGITPNEVSAPRRRAVKGASPSES